MPIISKMQLLDKLKTMKTRAGEPVAVFAMTEDPNRVRMTTREARQAGIPREKMRDAEELVDFIYEGQKRENPMNPSNLDKTRTVETIKPLLKQMFKEVKKRAQKEVKITSASFETLLPKKFTHFLKDANEPEIEKRLDTLLANEEKSSKGQANNGESWPTTIKKSLFSLLDDFEKDILTEIKNYKKVLCIILENEEQRVLQKNQKLEVKKEEMKITGIATEPDLGFARSIFSSSICYGPGGISRRHNSMEFGVLSQDSCFYLINGMNGEVAQKLDIGLKGNKLTGSSIEFSPDGHYFLASICADSKLVVYDSKTLTLQDEWTDSEAKTIRKARWMSPLEIAAGYSDPGKINIFQMGNNAPIKEFGYTSSGVLDLDFSSNKEFLYFGTGDGIVSKCSNAKKDRIGSEWTQELHSNLVRCVRVSSDQKYVLSSGGDGYVILAREKDGNFLFSFNGFSNKEVWGVIWWPDGQGAVAVSSNEVVLMRKESETLVKVAEVKKESLALWSLAGFNAFWGNAEKNEKSFLLLGEFNSYRPSQVKKLNLV